MFALVATALCAGAAKLADGATSRDRSLETTVAIEELIISRVRRDNFPGWIGQIDVFVGSAELQGPFRMRVLPAIPGQWDLTVEIVDMEKPAWDVAFELERAGKGYEDISEDRWLVQFSVKSQSCARLDKAVAALRDSFMEDVGLFAMKPRSPVQLSGVLHYRPVEVRMTGPEFQALSMTTQWPGPARLMPAADRVAQIAAGCAGKSVRRLSVQPPELNPY
jgi:hypothetical protein